MNKEESVVCEDEEEEKTLQALDEILLVLNKYNLRTQDLVRLLGDLSYSIGGAVKGLKPEDSSPTLDQLQKEYYEKPSLGTALMLQGHIVKSWHKQIVSGQASLETIKENNNG